MTELIAVYMDFPFQRILLMKKTLVLHTQLMFGTILYRHGLFGFVDYQIFCKSTKYFYNFQVWAWVNFSNFEYDYYT